MELNKPHPSRLVGGAETQNRLVSHPYVVDENSEGISQEQGVPASVQGSSARKISPPQLLAAKISEHWVSGRNFWNPKQFLFKEPTHRLIYSDSLCLSSSTRIAAWKAPLAYGEKLGCLASRWAEAIVPFLNPTPTELASCYHIWDSINLANTVCPTLEIRRDSAPPNFQAHPSHISIWMAGLGSCFTTS